MKPTITLEPMIRATLWLSLFACFPAAYAGPIAVIVSPETAQTFSYGHVIDHSLRWKEDAQALTASITFSNVNYVSDKERRVDETFDFVFPGVRFDRRTQTFDAQTESGALVPVAAVRSSVCGESIKPLSGTRFHVFKRNGRARVVLTADIDLRFGNHWVEHNEGFFLQNLVAQLAK